MSVQSDWATAIEELQYIADKLQGEEVAHGQWWIDIHAGLVTGGLFIDGEKQAVDSVSHLVAGATPGDLLDAQIAVAQTLVARGLNRLGALAEAQE